MIDVPFVLFLVLLAAILVSAVLADRRRRARARLAQRVLPIPDRSN